VSPRCPAADDRHTPDLPDAPGHCEIRLKGHLDARWAGWFEGLTLARENDGTTVLRGPVADQAALHGLLGRVRDLGLPLVSVTLSEPKRVGVPDDKP
jgi:hypothetical protein